MLDIVKCPVYWISYQEYTLSSELRACDLGSWQIHYPVLIPNCYKVYIPWAHHFFLCITLTKAFHHQPPTPAFSPCSILWLCRIANITENISFPCVFTVSVLWFHDFDQGFMFWHPDALGVLVPCQIGTSQAFQMVSFHWDGCSLESYSFALGLTKRCGYNVDVSSKRDFWVTHKIFPMLFPSLGVFHWFLPLEKSLN